MKKKILVAIALLLVTVVSLSSCRLIIGVVDFVQDIINPKIELTDEPLAAEKIIDFANGADPDVLFESDGWTNGDVFNVVWKKHNVIYADGIMRLGITEEKATAWLDDAEVEYDYTAGEARTQNYYHYGDYEVSMKPSANPGTASTFFTCTGPYDTKFVLDENGEYVLDENGQRLTVANPHDEIDIEFLGKDTTHVQFNFFVDGKGGNEYMHELGFDASEDFHTYGYRWTETSITWFVDGEPVYKVTTDTSVEEAGNLKIVEKIPQTPGRMLTNYWCGNERAVGWMGLYTGNTKDQGTEYQWMATSAQGAPLNPPEKPDDEVEGLDWSKIDAIAPTFETTELYTVTTEGTSANVTYTEVGGSCYKNVEMDITEASAGKNYLHLVVTNNGENPVRFRVNVVDMALVDAGAQNMSTNDSATVNGESAWTDHEWGGSFFDLAAGETYEIVIVFKGEVEKLQLMPDSSKNDSSVNAGNITISEIKFATVGEVEKPDEPQKPDEPVDTPTTGDTTALIDGVEVNFGGNTEVYGINANDADNTVNVKYNKVSTNTYLNVNAAIASVAAGKTDVSVKIKNNGTETVYITVKLEAAGAVALLEGKMEIPAGEEHTYNGNFAGVAEMLYFFIDTGWSLETTTHKGDVTITEIHFAGGEPAHEHSYNEGWCECGAYDPEYAFDTYAVVGTQGLCGTAWNLEITENDLSPVKPGVFAKVYENAPVGVHEFKVIKNRAWGAGNEFPTSNYKFYVFEAGCKVTISLDTTTGTVTCEVIDAKGNPVAQNNDFYLIVGANGLCGDIINTEKEGWGWELENLNNVLTLNADGKYEKVYTNIAAGNYGIKIVKNATWDTQWGDNGGDFNVNVDRDNATVTVIFDLEAGTISYTVADATPVDPPVEPPVDDGLQLNFWASSSDYTVNGNNIKYNGAGNSYSCVGSADIVAHAAGKTTFTVTITNNGTADARVRVDIQGTTQVGNHTVLNTAATGGDVSTDMEWGGSSVTVPAGQSVTLVITYDENTDRGAVTNLVVFVDSARGTGDTYSSDITLSGMAFSGEATPPVVEPELKDVALNVSDLTISTTTDEALAEGITASAGLAIDSNNKSIDGFSFTKRLKLGGTMKIDDGVVKAGIKLDVKGAAKIVLYAISSSSSDSTRTLQLATLTDGAFVKLAESAGVDGAAIAKYEFTVDAAGEYYLGSTKSGINIYYIAIEYTEQDDEPIDPPVEDNSYDITFGEETTAVGNPDKWYFWNDQNWCGSNVTVSGARYDDVAGKATFTYSGATPACWFGYQVFYKNPANELGKTYTLTCTIISDAAGDITINGQVVTLVAGENSIELTVAEGAGASFTLQCGNAAAGTVIAENTFSICDLTFTAVESGNEGGEGGDPVTPPSGSYTIVYADENGTVADPGVWHFWNDQWWCGSNVTVSDANYDAAADKATFTYSMEGSNWFGMQIFYKNPANEVGKTYTLTCTITSEAAGDITINGKVVTLVAGENNINLTIVQSAAASFSLQCGNEGAGTVIAANTISISGLTFTAVENGNPVTPPAEGEYLSYNANDCYVLSATPDQYVNTLTVSYTAAYRDTYLNVNTYVLDKAAGKSTMLMSIKNESDKTVTITVKLEGEGGQSDVKFEKTVEIAAGETLNLSEAYGDGAKMLYFFIDTGWSNNTITEAQSGTVVISGVSFQ